LQGAWLCTHNVEVDEGHVRHVGEVTCTDFQGARLQGADLRGAQICDSYEGTKHCEPASADMLRKYGHADLSGATGP